MFVCLDRGLYQSICQPSLIKLDSKNQKNKENSSPCGFFHADGRLKPFCGVYLRKTNELEEEFTSLPATFENEKPSHPKQTMRRN